MLTQMEIHPSQRRISCEACRRSKTKCQRLRVDDAKCIRCTLADTGCDNGEQRKVGRPKRKAVAFSSAPKHHSASKRQKRTSGPSSRATLANEDYPVQHVSSFSESFRTSAQMHAETDAVSHQLAVFAPIPKMPDLVSGEWPTAMSDIWHDNALSQAVSSRICQRRISVSRHDANAAAVTIKDNISMRPPGQPTLVLPEFMDIAFSHNSRSWMSPDFRITHGTTSEYPLVTKRRGPLPFGIGRPPAFYIHANQFSSNIADISSNVSFKDPMVTLLSIIHGLRLRSNIVQANRSRLDLSHLIQREGSLFIDTYSLVGNVMVSAEQLVRIVASILNTSASARSDDGKLSMPLVSTTMNVYCLILSFSELFIQHLTEAAERIATNPVKPIPGLRFNGIVIPGAGSQGTLICSSIFYLLGRVESVLGLDTASAGNGLFTASQIEMLQRRLDESDGLVQMKGVMRPADVRNLFMRVTSILEQLALTELV